jgi:hypothetical protein
LIAQIERYFMPQETEVLLQKSSLYREYRAAREEILKHKWIESEKAGHDIGFEKALTDWIHKHSSNWRKSRPSHAPLCLNSQSMCAVTTAQDYNGRDNVTPHLSPQPLRAVA